MNRFEWMEPASLESAVHGLGPRARLLAGGVDLLGEMKDHIALPERVVNLKSVSGLDAIEIGDHGLRLGALVTLDRLAAHPQIRHRWRAIAEAASSVGTPQIRNQGTLGGNLCQRPRCWYFRSEEHKCLKKGGDICFAVAGENKYHAILGGGPAFYAHPSDLAPALLVLNAQVRIAGPGPRGRGLRLRTLPLAEFYRTPAQRLVGGETLLSDQEIVTEILVPEPFGDSTYLKFRERLSHDWAMAACAAQIQISAGHIKRAQLALGGVATIPWPVPAAARALAGQPLNQATIEAAAHAAVAGAQPLRQNWYKIQLTQTLVRRAIRQAAFPEKADFVSA